MAYSLGSEEEVIKSQRDAEVESQKKSSEFLKIDDGKNYVALVSEKFKHGFVHAIKTSQDTTEWIPCSDKPGGKGFDPENCPICAKMMDLYAQARMSKNQAKSDLIKKQANELRPALSYLLIGKKGRSIIKVDNEGKESLSCTFVKEKTEEQEQNNLPGDPTPEQLVRLGGNHWNELKNIVEDKKINHIKSMIDFTKFVFVLDKIKPEGKLKKMGKIIPKVTKIQVDLKKLNVNAENVNRLIAFMDSYFNVPEESTIQSALMKNAKFYDNEVEFEQQKQTPTNEEEETDFNDNSTKQKKEIPQTSSLDDDWEKEENEKDLPF